MRRGVTLVAVVVALAVGHATAIAADGVPVLVTWRVPTDAASSARDAADVSIRLGDFSATVPAGSLRRLGGARWAFRSRGGGIARLVLQRRGSEWSVAVRLRDIAPLRLVEPTIATVGVGGSTASTVTRARAARGGGLRFVVDADVDSDGDGISPHDGDCDDTRADVHPGAAERAGDGVDQDCSGADLTSMIGTWPVDGASPVGVFTPTTIMFSAPLDPSTVDAGVARARLGGTTLGSTATLAADGRSITVAYAILPPQQHVEVAIDAGRLRDVHGGPVDVDGVEGGTAVIAFDTDTIMPEAEAPACDLTGQWHGNFVGFDFMLTLTQDASGAFTGTLVVPGMGTAPVDGEIVGVCIQGTIRGTQYGDVLGHGAVAPDCNSFEFQTQNPAAAFTVFRG